jgi:hypothetical protein
VPARWYSRTLEDQSGQNKCRPIDTDRFEIVALASSAVFFLVTDTVAAAAVDSPRIQKIKFLSVLLLSFSWLLPIRSLADSIVLNCSYIEVLTGTNGAVQKYSVQRIIKVGDDIYQVWSSKDLEWGGNQCGLGHCAFDSKVFSYELDDVDTYDGYLEEHMEKLIFDRATGRLTAEKKTSTTSPVTAYQAETTWYDNGTCTSSADPATSPRRKL